MANNAVIITDCDHYDIEIETEILSKNAIKFQKKQCKTEQDLIEQCQDAAVWINQYAPITENVLANSPNLKLVIRYGVGVNNVDVQAATKYGVQVCNVPDYGTQEVADHALACLLTLTRKVSQMSSLVKTRSLGLPKEYSCLSAFRAEGGNNRDRTNRHCFRQSRACAK